MARKTQPYASIAQFAERNQLILPRPFCWRLIQDPPTGEIQGISGIRGFAIATNGIIVALESDQGDIAFGHLDYFNPDADSDPKPLTSKFPKQTKKTIDINEYR